MARARPDHPSAEATSGLADAQGRLAVRVTTGVRVELLEIVDGRLLAKVRAKPENGKANAAVLNLLSNALGMPTSRLRVLRGATSREKLVQIGD
jgi:uncharacterized protein